MILQIPQWHHRHTYKNTSGDSDCRMGVFLQENRGDICLSCRQLEDRDFGCNFLSDSPFYTNVPKIGLTLLIRN